MTKGFGKTQQRNSLSDAAEILHAASKKAGKPLLMPMFPPDNEVGLKPGQLAPGQTEIRPSCDGIVIAVRCSAADAQELLDLMTDWERKRLERGGDRA